MQRLIKNIVSCYKPSIKSRVSDELINTYFIRPVAHIFVYSIRKTGILPTQIVLLNTIFGILTAFFVLRNEMLPAATALFLKNIFDAVDGQLARLNSLVSREGRFLDSISDFIVNVAIFVSFAVHLYSMSNNISHFILAILSLLSINLRVTYFVFYQVKFLNLDNKYPFNRPVEKVTGEDKLEKRHVYYLQLIYQKLYGWQDYLVNEIDRHNLEYLSSQNAIVNYYSDKRLLRLSSYMGLGTETSLIIIFLFFNKVYEYLWVNIFILNSYCIFNIFMRNIYAKKLSEKSQ